jgi:hypothetical protein
LPIKLALLPRTSGAPSGVAIVGDGLFFTCGGAAIYRIGLDGTGLERVFPGKQPLTLAQFEADVASRGPR